MLNVLAGVVPKNSQHISGKVLYDHVLSSVYVQQEDILFAQLTTYETLETSAILRAANHLNVSKRQSIIEKLILKLGLKKVSNTKVGDAKTRGVSGGEKKRIAIGNELIGCDNEDEGIIFYADEPTSGLDTYSSLQVMQKIKSLTNNGKNSAIISIHQPRAAIYKLFDEITILAEGKVVFSGDREELLPYFSSLGYTCPSNVNPAEYYVDLVSINYSSPEDEQESRDRIDSLASQFQQKRYSKYSQVASSMLQQTSSSVESSTEIKRQSGPFLHKLWSTAGRTLKEFRVLFIRAWRNVTRDKPLFIARFMSGLFSALLFGAIYYKMGDSSATVPDRLGLLQVAAVNTAMTSLIKATTTFVVEKNIVQRERRSRSYSIFPYFLSKLAAELPLSALFPCLSGLTMYKLCGLNKAPGKMLNFLSILVVESMASTAFGLLIGSVAPSVDSAVAIAPSLMVIFIVFGGLYVVNTPAYLNWVPKISLIRWAYEALCINEFDGLVLKPKSNVGPLSVTSGSQVLASMGMANSSVKKALIAQGMIALVNYALTFTSLLLQRPASESIRDVDNENNSEKTSKTGMTSKTVIAKPPLFL